MHPDLQQIKQAAEGLFYISESDYPFEAIELGKGTYAVEDKLQDSFGKGTQAGIEKVSIDYFLRNMTRIDGNMADEQKQRAERFSALQQIILQKLADVAVYRMGTVQIDVYIIGRSADGLYMGLKTKAIET